MVAGNVTIRKVTTGRVVVDVETKILIGWTDEDEPIYADTVAINSTGGGPTVPLSPLAPQLEGTMPSRTTVNLSWTPAENGGRPALIDSDVEVRSSTNDGVSFGAWAPITGSPFAVPDFDAALTGLSTGTPEVLREYRARLTNGDGDGEWSNVLPLQWAATPIAQPTAPTNFVRGATNPTDVTVSWQETTDTSITKHGLFIGSTLVLDNIAAGARSVTWTGRTPGSVISQLNVKRANLDVNGAVQWSPASNIMATFTMPTAPPTSFTMLIGVDGGENDHGGYDDWDVFRVYNRSDWMSFAARSGTAKPKALIYSELGSNTTYTYQQARDHYLDDLNAFYYVGGATSQTRSSRWGVASYIMSGNENSDKGDLQTPHTAAGISRFVAYMHGLYDACHYIDPSTGQRRFPDAYAGSNPTTQHEFDGIVWDWLEPSAQYHDFVGWSMYAPGRTNTASNPTLNWPSFVESRRTNYQDGFLIRCFYRTKQAEAAARQQTGDPTRKVRICTGEFGIGDVPNYVNSSGATVSGANVRPYYIVMGYVGSMYQLALQYGLEMPVVCYWDKLKNNDTANPQNVLSDEPASANPSSATALRNWRTYDPRAGGTKAASWAGFPVSSWKDTGTPI